MNNKKIKSKTLVFFLVVIIVVLAIFTLIPKLLSFFGYLIWLLSPFIIAYLLSLLLNPLVDKLERRLKIPRGICAILVMILIIGVLGGIITAIVLKIVNEVKVLCSDWSSISENIMSTWNAISNFFSDFVAMLPANMKDTANNLLNNAIDLLTRFATNVNIVSSAGNFAMKLPGIFIVSIVFILSLYFMIKDSRKVSAVLRKPFSEDKLKKFDEARTEMKKCVGGYIKAQLIIMCISFTIILIGLSILKINYAPLIALGIAFIDALPFFGSGAILWPWAAVALIMGDTIQSISLVIIYLAVILMRQFVEPKIVSKNIGIHPLLTLMSMYVGFRLCSLGGMILGPITMIIIISLYRTGLFDGVVASSKMFLNKFGREVKNITNSLSDKESEDEE